MSYQTDRLRSEQFKGLSYDVPIVNGRFLLDSGVEKVDKNVLMFLDFTGYSRTYSEDFTIDLGWFIQKNTHIAKLYKVAVLGRIQSALKKYLPYVLLKNIDLTYDKESRKEIGVLIDYQTEFAPDRASFRAVQFL